MSDNSYISPLEAQAQRIEGIMHIVNRPPSCRHCAICWLGRLYRWAVGRVHTR